MREVYGVGGGGLSREGWIGRELDGRALKRCPERRADDDREWADCEGDSRARFSPKKSCLGGGEKEEARGYHRAGFWLGILCCL